jgi:hypothetical protein
VVCSVEDGKELFDGKPEVGEVEVGEAKVIVEELHEELNLTIDGLIGDLCKLPTGDCFGVGIGGCGGGEFQLVDTEFFGEFLVGFTGCLTEVGSNWW